MSEITINTPEIILGTGNNRDVVLGTWNNQPVAVKKSIFSHPDIEEEALRKLDHPNVIKFFHAETKNSCRYFALELCHGTLDKLFSDDSSIQYRGPMPPDEDVLLQLAAGLHYIHSKGYFHRDIKPANVLIKVRDSYNYEGDHRRVLMKWTDFDFSKQSESSDVSISRTTGTWCWKSPEILNEQTQSKHHLWTKHPSLDGNKSDVFSEGLVFVYFLKGGVHPFGDLGKVEANIRNGTEPNLEDITDGPIKELVKEMLLNDPDSRPTSKKVYERLSKLCESGPVNEPEEVHQKTSDKLTFDRNKILGRGSFATVYEGSFEGKLVAVKRLIIKERELSSENMNKREWDITTNLNHPNVVKLLGYKEDDDFIYLALELCQAKLDECFSKDYKWCTYKGPMPSQEEILLQLSQGLAYIHAKKLIHRDLKPSNAMIWNGTDAFGRQKVLVKWIDFGCCKFTDDQGETSMSGIKGTFTWMAPEHLENSFDNERTSTKADIFSEALVFGYILLKGKHLFGSTGNHIEIPSNIRNDNPINLKQIESERYVQLLVEMLHNVPLKRWNAFDVVEEMEDIKHKVTYKLLPSRGRLYTEENISKYLNEKQITKGKISYNLNTLAMGAGGYGLVYAGKWDNQMEIAVKIISNKEINDKEEEIRNNKMFNHVNVAKMIGFEKDDSSKYFALELCVASLDRVFLPEGKEKRYYGLVSLPSDFEVMYQLALGLEYIHSQNVAHRDVAPRNILIHVNSNTQKVTMKWTDFGLSRFTDDDGTFLMDDVLGSPKWMAPELQKLLKEKEDKKDVNWSQQRGTIKSDIFAEGLVFAFIILKGVHPYAPKEKISKSYYDNEDKQLENVIKQNIRENKPVHLEDVQPRKVLELIKQMLQVDPDKRLTSTQVVQAITENIISETELLELNRTIYSTTSSTLS